MGRLFDGSCRICGDEYKGQGITSHVKKCLAESANVASIHHGLLLGVRSDGPAGRFWMYLLVRPEASLERLDEHFRETWFGDGDQPSVFNIEGTQYLSTIDESSETPEGEPIEPMEVDIGSTLRPRIEFEYLYDPQSPTELEVTVYDPYPIPESIVDDPAEANVVTVARNDLEPISCSSCEGDAIGICPICAAADEPKLGRFACEECADKHEAELVPFRNSPRAGRD